MTGRSTATISITSAKTAADTTGWILKRRKGSTFLFSMWPVPIVGQPCREKFIKQLKHFPTLLRFRTDENLISGLELWFLTSFQGKPVWALNREHLAYLIDYLSADLREKPLGRAKKKTQADHLPPS